MKLCFCIFILSFCLFAEENSTKVVRKKTGQLELPKDFWQIEAKLGAYNFFMKNISDYYKNDYKYSIDETKEALSQVQIIYSEMGGPGPIGPIKNTMNKSYFLKSDPSACFLISTRNIDSFGLFYQIEGKPHVELRQQKLNYMSVKHFTSFLFWLSQIKEERVTGQPGRHAVSWRSGMNDKNKLVIVTGLKNRREYLGNPYTSFGPGITDKSYANASGQLLEKFLGEKIQTEFTDSSKMETLNIDQQFKIVDFVLDNYDENFSKEILHDCLSLIEYHNALKYKSKIEKLLMKVSIKSRLQETLYKLSIIDDLDLILNIAKNPEKDYKWAFRLIKKFPDIYLEALEPWVFNNKFGHISFKEMYKTDPKFAGRFFKKHIDYFRKSGLINHTTKMKLD
ncbi:MAG: hypothetical protein NE334_11610 [Lentisphaeraceae bacterium]|nr:hypothetical protein [Lentisphaeraceae bacterium]